MSFITRTTDHMKSMFEHKSDPRLPRIVLTFATTLLFAGLLAALLFIPIPEGSSDVLFLLVGVLVKMLSSTYEFWFGTSQGSAEKQRTLSALLPGGEPPRGGVVGVDEEVASASVHGGTR